MTKEFEENIFFYSKSAPKCCSFRYNVLSLQADFGNILWFMVNLDMNKLKGHKSFDSYLNEQYGEENSVERKEFEVKAKAWYRSELYKANIKNYG